MVKKPIVQIRDTEKKDGDLIVKWLLQPGVLEGFPMTTRPEIEDAVRIWIDYATPKTSVTALYKKAPCGAGNLYIQTVEKLKHQCLFVVIVDANYRRKGIGTIVIRELERRAKERFGIEILHLEVYENNPAIKLYEHLGFVRYGTHKKFLKDVRGIYYDKVLMEKRLG